MSVSGKLPRVAYKRRPRSVTISVLLRFINDFYLQPYLMTSLCIWLILKTMRFKIDLQFGNSLILKIRLYVTIELGLPLSHGCFTKEDMLCLSMKLTKANCDTSILTAVSCNSILAKRYVATAHPI